MKAQGKDYGGYTVVDPAKVKAGYETDFSIVGFGWGKNVNTTWPKNKVYFKDFKRKMLYSTFQHAPGWTAQFDFILKEVTENKGQAYFLDIERSEWGFREDLNKRQQSLDIERILKYLREKELFQVGFYCGFYMHYILSQNIDLSSYQWWCASPDDDPANHPGSLNLWKKWAGNRTLYDYTFDQWSWEGYAPNYGAINEKKSIDLTQCKNDLVWLDSWLGLEDAPPIPPPPDSLDDWNMALDKGIEALEELKK